MVQQISLKKSVHFHDLLDLSNTTFNPTFLSIYCLTGFYQKGNRLQLKIFKYLRGPYITYLNVLQPTRKQIRDPNLSKETMASSKQDSELMKVNPTSEYARGLEDTLTITMKVISAGMQNTGWTKLVSFPAFSFPDPNCVHGLTSLVVGI